MQRGYIPVWRKITDFELNQRPDALTLYINILLEAKITDERVACNGQIVDLKKGQLVFGRNQWIKKTGLTESKLRTSLNYLEKIGFVKIEPRNKFSIITAIGYEEKDKDNKDKEAIQKFADDISSKKYNINACNNLEIQENNPADYPTEQPQNNGNLSTVKELKTKNKTSSLSADKVPYQDLIDLFHEVLPMLPKVKVLTEKRKNIIKKLWLFAWKEKQFENNEQALNFFRRYFESVSRSQFLTGENARGWKADIEFVFSEKCFLDKYENGGKYR